MSHAVRRHLSFKHIGSAVLGHKCLCDCWELIPWFRVLQQAKFFYKFFAKVY